MLSLQWLGFGPEQLSIPKTFEIGVSSFGQYGGHASIRVRYDAQATSALYRMGDPAPGNSIAFLQGMPFLGLVRIFASRTESDYRHSFEI
jgi:hypothetical protein